MCIRDRSVPYLDNGYYYHIKYFPGKEYPVSVSYTHLQKLKDKIDVILCIHAGAIERKKIRADFGITYDVDALKTIDDFSCLLYTSRCV